jgi:hypothetical protein
MAQDSMRALHEELLDTLQGNRAIAADALSSFVEVVALHQAMFDVLAELLDWRPYAAEQDATHGTGR